MRDQQCLQTNMTTMVSALVLTMVSTEMWTIVWTTVWTIWTNDSQWWWQWCSQWCWQMFVNKWPAVFTNKHDNNGVHNGVNCNVWTIWTNETQWCWQWCWQSVDGVLFSFVLNIPGRSFTSFKYSRPAVTLLPKRAIKDRYLKYRWSQHLVLLLFANSQP